MSLRPGWVAMAPYSLSPAHVAKVPTHEPGLRESCGCAVDEGRWRRLCRDLIAELRGAIPACRPFRVCDSTLHRLRSRFIARRADKSPHKVQKGTL